MILDIKSPVFRNNPYPTYHYLRSEKQLCRTKPFNDLLIANYEDVKKILKQPDVFGSADIIAVPAASDGPEFLLETRGLVGYDKPHHTKVRGYFNKFFTLTVMQTFESQIRLIIKNLISNIVKVTSTVNMINIVDDFTKPLPVLVLAELLGISEKSIKLKEWSHLLLTWRDLGKTPQVCNSAKDMFNFFKSTIEQKQQNPQNDLISKFILATEKAPHIYQQEILAMLRLLLFAGSEPVTNLISNGIFILCNRPELQEQLAAHPSLIDNFIEEILRFNGPILTLSRRVKIDFELGITQLKAGEIVLPLLASANHDETIFRCPEKFDIHRHSRPHLSFGSGIHYCLGAHLARLQARIAFEELFKVFKKFQIASKENPVYLDAFFFRGIKKLWLLTGKYIN